MDADLIHEGKLREIAAWGKFDVYAQRKTRRVSKKIAQTRWVLTSEIDDGQKLVRARLVAKGFHDSDLQ